MMLYPMRVKIDLLITDGKGQEGVATYACRPFSLPDEAAMGAVKESVLASLPDGFRFMTRHEAQTYEINERTRSSEVFALIPLEDGEEWHDPETANVHIERPAA